MKKFYRYCIDFLVVVMALVFLLPYALSYIPIEYVDETLPDDVVALDAEIQELLQTLDKNFDELYENPTPIGTFSLRTNATSPVVRDTLNYEQNAPSVVYITVEDSYGDIYSGSGTILSESGLILTNYHLLVDVERAVVTTYDGQHYPVTGVVATDELLDITFLKIDAQDLTPITVGDSEAIAVGDKTLVIGHPEKIIYTLSVGNVGGIRLYNANGHGKQIQITNPISAGNSGGAVLNEYGELIAVPSWTIEYEDNIVQVQNLNFAVPINEALDVLDQNNVEWELTI